MWWMSWGAHIVKPPDRTWVYSITESIIEMDHRLTSGLYGTNVNKDSFVILYPLHCAVNIYLMMICLRRNVIFIKKNVSELKVTSSNSNSLV